MPVACSGKAVLLCGACAAAAGAAGCASSRVTDPARTATEQFLLSRAAANAVDDLSFEVLRGRRVFVDAQYFAASDQPFVLGEVRAKLLRSGVQITRTVDEAQVVLEVRSGGVGIDRNDFLLGIPSLQLGGVTATSDIPLVTPELALLKNRYQTGVAAVAYVAYWAASGEIVAASGPFVGRSLRDDWWFFGAGPRAAGNIPTVEAAP